MRDRTKYGNLYYAELFIIDIKAYEYVYSVGIDMSTKRYVTEYMKCIERSFVTYSENTYTEIDYNKYLKYLEQALSNGNISIERYNELKEKEEPDMTSVIDIGKCYEKLAKQSIQEQQSYIYIPSKLEINEKHIYVNYDGFCDKNNFCELYLNRYSQNQGWCVRIVQNAAGYKLSVIYNENKLPDLFDEKTYMKFLSDYNSSVEIYDKYDVYEKQITSWERDYLIHYLEKEHFYELLSPKMIVNNSKSVGYTGACNIFIKYKTESFFSNGEKVIHGYTENDNKSACGIDFYGFIQKCLGIANNKSRLVIS